MKTTLLFLFILSASARAHVMTDTCASPETDASLEAKTAAGIVLKLCGFEDHEVKAPKGRRVFSDFVVYAHSGSLKAPQKIYQSDDSETYWVRVNGTQGLEFEELWFFTEKPEAGLRREITCTADGCAVSAPKCVYKPKKNPFPRALKEFERKLKSGELKNEGEELVDQIFAQALGGDKEAVAFYEKPAPGLVKLGLTPALAEVHETNRKKLALGCR